MKGEYELAGPREGKMQLCYSPELICTSFSANLTAPCSTLTLLSSMFTSRNLGTFSLQVQNMTVEWQAWGSCTLSAPVILSLKCTFGHG